MAGIMKTMSTEKAWHVLEKNNLTSPALVAVAGDLMEKNRIGPADSFAAAFLKRTNLRKKQPKGYAGLEGARNLLNDMIFESMSKYDAEIAKCTDYYSTQCSAMEACRGQIAASNFIAANSRTLILDAQAITILWTLLSLLGMVRPCASSTAAVCVSAHKQAT